jgi:hypothetical protein
VTIAVPLFPSLVAVIVVDPGDTAITLPVGETLATPGALLVHASAVPGSTFPAASLRVAVKCVVDVTNRSRAAGSTVTDATG